MARCHTRSGMRGDLLNSKKLTRRPPKREEVFITPQDRSAVLKRLLNNFDIAFDSNSLEKKDLFAVHFGDMMEHAYTLENSN